MLVRQCPQAFHELIRSRANAALALNGFHEKSRSIGTDRRLGSFEVVEFDVFEPGEQGQKALVHLFLIRRADRRHRPAVEGVLEGDQFVLVIVTGVAVIGARRLDCAFDGFGARIGEEHRVSKGQVDDPAGQRFTLRAAVKVRYVHQCFRLTLDRADQSLVRMAQDVDRDAGGEIEIALPVFTDQMAMVAFDGPEGAPRVNRHKRRDRHRTYPLNSRIG